MRFWKYEGLGNDFVVLDERTEPANPLRIGSQEAIRLCDRHFGIGADGVLHIGRPTLGGVARMTVLNADGSEAEMCGNGLRCVARHVARSLPEAAEHRLSIETGAGLRECRVRADAVDVCLGPVRDDGRQSFGQGELTITGRLVNLGNPHFVLDADAGRAEALALGDHFQPGGLLPQGANLSCRRFRAPGGGDLAVDLTVYERGCGLTLACGTGAGATVAAAWLDGRVPIGTPIDVYLPGGRLRISGSLEALWLSGPARLVFGGEWDGAL